MIVLPVREQIRATPRTRIVRLDLDGHAFTFRAGQAVLVGPEGSPVRKPYSIAASPGQTRTLNAIELLVQIDGGDEPDPHLDRARPGARTEVDGPFGSFALPEDAAERDVLFIAGGTGIAPLRSMLWDMLERGGAGRLTLLYSARARDEFAYREEFDRLATEGKLDLHLTVTREGDQWTGLRGRIDLALIESVQRTPLTRAVICGPPAMVAHATALVQAAGIGPDRVLIETGW